MSGIGKRFVQSGYSDPKPLIEIDGLPIINHVVNLFPGIEDVIFICNDNHLVSTNMREVLQNISPNCRIIGVSNENRQGPVHAVSQIFDLIENDKKIIVSYCDYGTVWDFQGFIKLCDVFDGVIPCYTGFHPHMLGSDNYAFCKHDNMDLIEIKEKEPFTTNKMSEYASNGTYFFKSGSILKKYFRKLIDLGISVNGEYYVSLVYNLMVKDRLKVRLFEIDKMLQWGTPYDLEIYRGWGNYFAKSEMTIKSNPVGTTLVLPLAGRGNRFLKDGYGKPKPLINVDDKPMIVRAVNCLPKSDKSIFICLNEHIQEYGIDKTLSEEYPNCDIIGLNQVTEGQACTCEIGITHFNVNLENPIMISACDNGVHYDVEKFNEMVNDDGIDVIVWTFRNNQTSKVNPDMYAWLDVDDDGFVHHVSCKKFIYEDPLKTHAIVGTMFFRKAKYFLDGLKKNKEQNIRTNNEFYVDDVLNQNIKDGLKVKVFEVENYICWGTPNDYKTYNYWKDHFKKNN